MCPYAHYTTCMQNLSFVRCRNWALRFLLAPTVCLYFSDFILFILLNSIWIRQQKRVLCYFGLWSYSPLEALFLVGKKYSSIVQSWWYFPMPPVQCLRCICVHEVLNFSIWRRTIPKMLKNIILYTRDCLMLQSIYVYCYLLLSIPSILCT